MNIFRFAAIWRWGMGPAFCVLFGLGASVPAQAKSTWLKLETKDFVAYSDASEKDLAETAIQYAAYRQAFRSLFLPPERSVPPSTLLLFRRRADFEKHIIATHEEHSVVTNYTASVDGRPLLAFPIAGDRAQALQLTFEFETIWALQRVGYYVPVWMSQGAGEVLATLEAEKDYYTLGDAPLGHDSQFSNGDNIEWPHFFEIGELSPEYRGKHADGSFHSQAWALMHWILLSDDASRERFTALAVKLETAPGLQAVVETTHTPADQLRRTILRHLSHFHTRRIPFDRAALRASLKIVPADEAEVLVQTSNLLAACNRIPEANAELDRARSLAPNHPAVLEALARRAYREGRPDQAAELYHAAVAAGSTSVSAYLRSASARLDESSNGNTDTEGGAGTNAARAIDELHRALDLAPGESEVYRLLARAYYVSPTLSPAQIEELNPGVTRGAAGEAVRYYRGLLYFRLGRDAAAIADFHAIGDDPNISDDQRGRALETLSRHLLAKVSSALDRAVHEEDSDAGREALASVHESDLTDAGRQQLAHLRDWFGEVVSWDPVVKLFRDQDWDAAEAGATKYLAEHPRGSNRKQAERMLKEIARLKRANQPSPPSTPAEQP